MGRPPPSPITIWNGLEHCSWGLEQCSLGLDQCSQDLDSPRVWNGAPRVRSECAGYNSELTVKVHKFIKKKNPSITSTTIFYETSQCNFCFEVNINDEERYVL